MNIDGTPGINTGYTDQMGRTVITSGQNTITLTSSEIKDLDNWVTSASKSLAKTVAEKQDQVYMNWEHDCRERLRDCMSMSSHDVRFIGNRPSLASELTKKVDAIKANAKEVGRLGRLQVQLRAAGYVTIIDGANSITMSAGALNNERLACEYRERCALAEKRAELGFGLIVS